MRDPGDLRRYILPRFSRAILNELLKELSDRCEVVPGHDDVMAAQYEAMPLALFRKPSRAAYRKLEDLLAGCVHWADEQLKV